MKTITQNQHWLVELANNNCYYVTALIAGKKPSLQTRTRILKSEAYKYEG